MELKAVGVQKSPVLMHTQRSGERKKKHGDSFFKFSLELMGEATFKVGEHFKLKKARWALSCCLMTSAMFRVMSFFSGGRGGGGGGGGGGSLWGGRGGGGGGGATGDGGRLLTLWTCLGSLGDERGECLGDAAGRPSSPDFGPKVGSPIVPLLLLLLLHPLLPLFIHVSGQEAGHAHSWSWELEMVTQPQQRGVLPQQLDDLHLHLAAHDVPLVVEAQLGEHGVVLQSPHDGQDALARDEVGLDVDAGDVAVDLQHFRNGGGHAVVGVRVGQTEGLHHRVGLEGLRETDEGLRRDVLDIVQIDFRGVRVVVFHLFQSILDHRRVSTGVDGSRGLCVPSAVAVGQMYVFNLAFKCLWPRVVRIDTTAVIRDLLTPLVSNNYFSLMIGKAGDPLPKGLARLSHCTGARLLPEPDLTCFSLRQKHLGFQHFLQMVGPKAAAPMQ
ncbi:hypothetical protein DBR06_SOUSAS16210011 [Sousa chinensis]|uniref:Uncharacterized protein n=1 Tax=Sousa chinensis TaxID=103600 RepID=A0A484GG59_SOUCH|nr:hypothetical protein DBR06_SOUSAS16210011 [Sousa chinensis]